MKRRRIWVATAFVPFRRRRVDALAQRMVMALGDLGAYAAWLRVPVDGAHPDTGSSAAGAALIDLAGADCLIALEAPCFRLAASATSGFLARGGFDPLVVPDRFGPIVIELGREDGPEGRREGVPRGLLAWWLRHQGILSTNGTGTLAIQVAAPDVIDARRSFTAERPIEIVHGVAASSAPADMEAGLWAALADVRQRGFARVEIAHASDITPDQLTWIRHDGGLGVDWASYPTSDSKTVAPGDALTEATNEEWIAFVRGLMP